MAKKILKATFNGSGYQEAKEVCLDCYIAQGEDCISLCPFHASTLDLLKALKFLMADYIAIDGPELTVSNVPLNKAQEAIAKAEGK